jgi:hypothetical protein
MHDARTPSDDDERDELLDTIATLLLDSIEKDVPKPERADVVARRVWLDGFRWRPRRLHSAASLREAAEVVEVHARNAQVI